MSESSQIQRTRNLGAPRVPDDTQAVGGAMPPAPPSCVDLSVGRGSGQHGRAGVIERGSKPTTTPGTGAQVVPSTIMPPKRGAARGLFALGFTRGRSPEGQGQCQQTLHQGGHIGPGTGHGRARGEDLSLW